MLPGIAGVAIYQINIVVTRLLASFLPQGVSPISIMDNDCSSSPRGL